MPAKAVKRRSQNKAGNEGQEEIELLSMWEKFPLPPSGIKQYLSTAYYRQITAYKAHASRNETQHNQCFKPKEIWEWRDMNLTAWDALVTRGSGWGSGEVARRLLFSSIHQCAPRHRAWARHPQALSVRRNSQYSEATKKAAEFSRFKDAVFEQCCSMWVLFPFYRPLTLGQSCTLLSLCPYS